MSGDVAHIGVTGDVCARSFIGSYDCSFGGNVIRNRGADDRNGRSSFLCSDNSRSSVTHNQINAVINKLGHDGGAVGGFTTSQLNIESNLVAQLFGQCILEALSCLVKGNMLHQLNNTDGVSAIVFLCSATSAEAQQHHGGHNQCKYAFHNFFLLFLLGLIKFKGGSVLQQSRLSIQRKGFG